MPPVRLVFTLPGLLAATEQRDLPRSARGADAPAPPGGRAERLTAPHLARLVAAAGAPEFETDGTAAALARV